MDLAQIRALIEMVAESGVAEIEIEEDDFKLTVRTSAPQITMQSSAPSFSPFGMAGFPPPYQQQGQAQSQPMPQGQPAPQQQAQQQAPAQQQAAPSQEAAAGTPSESGGGDEAAASESGVTVPAPIVGTFYRAPSPDADPFVEVGDTVKEGDILCIIEAMKLMNEIECETPGTIKDILIDDAEPVEYEQPLFVIEPS